MYYTRTISCINDHLITMDEIIGFEFIPSIAGGNIFSYDKLVLLSLPTRFGALGILSFRENAVIEFENLENFTSFNQRSIGTILPKQS